MQMNYMQYIFRPDSYLSQRLLGMQFSMISCYHHVTMLLMAYSTFAYIRLIYMFSETTHVLYLIFITYLLSP